jgi:hypothetical protein
LCIAYQVLDTTALGVLLFQKVGDLKRLGYKEWARSSCENELKLGDDFDDKSWMGRHPLQLIRRRMLCCKTAVVVLKQSKSQDGRKMVVGWSIEGKSEASSQTRSSI